MAKKNQVTASGIRSLMSAPQADDTETNNTPPTPEATQPIERATYGRGQKSPNRRTMVGAGVKATEKTELQEIANAEGVALNALIAFFVRHSLANYKAGKLKIPKTVKTVIDMP